MHLSFKNPDPPPQPGPQGKVNGELPTPIHVCPTNRVLPFKCQLVTRDDKYDDSREMKTLCGNT